MRGISWLAAEPVSFSRRTLRHGVSKYVKRKSRLVFQVTSASGKCVSTVFVYVPLDHSKSKQRKERKTHNSQESYSIKSPCLSLSMWLADFVIPRQACNINMGSMLSFFIRVILNWIHVGCCKLWSSIHKNHRLVNYGTGRARVNIIIAFWLVI